MVDYQTIAVTAFVTFFALAFVAMLFWFMFYLQTKKNNIDLRINYWTGGKTQVIRAIGRINKDDSSQVISNKIKKKYGFFAIPYFGAEYTYPTDKTNRIEYPLSFYQGTFSPEVYEPKEEVEIPTIEITEADVKGKTKKVAKQIKKKVTQFIINPVNYDIKRWSIEKETELQSKYSNDTFFSKYGAAILGFTILVICGVVGILMLVFAYQYGLNFNEAPAWVQQLTEQISQTIKPPA